MTPRRIQRKRERGWRMPEGAVAVTRGTRFGNPFRVDGTIDERQCDRWGWNVRRCRDMASMGPLHAFESAVLSLSDGGKRRIRGLLGGKDLARWCREGEPCHADILLRLANEPAP